MSTHDGVLMGHLREIVVRIGDEDIKLKCPRKLLGWLPGSRQLVILNSGRRGDGTLSGRAASLHRQFHNQRPNRAHRYEWPDPVGQRRNVGLVVSLVYSIPNWLKSPEKNRYYWNHEFGDHGERGHGPVRGSGNYPEKYMPMLQIDEAGNLYIRRRAGNRYFVKDWLYW